MYIHIVVDVRIGVGTYLFVYLCVYECRCIHEVGGSLNKFPDFFRMGTFIDRTHMKL